MRPGTDRRGAGRVAARIAEARAGTNGARRARAAAGDPEAVPAADDPVDLGGLERHAGYLVRRLQLWIFQDFVRCMGDADIRPAQYSVLSVIAANPGLRQIALAQRLGIERARLVGLLDGLEERGLAERVASPRDRRSHALYLTPAGERFLEELRRRAAAHEANVAALLGAENRERLVAMLSVLADP